MGKRKKLLNYCLICIIFVLSSLPIRLVKGKVECYKFPFHVDNNKIYYPDWHRKILFAHSKENCSIVQRISGMESFFRFLLGDEKYFFNFPEKGYMEVIDKQKGEKVFSQKLTLPIYIFGHHYHISPENIWLTGEYLLGDFYQESLLRINRKNFRVDILPICMDCAVRIVSEKPIYYPFEPIGGYSNSKEMGKEFLLLVNELSWIEEKKGKPIRIQVFSVKDEGSEEVSMEKIADFQVPSTLVPFELKGVWKDRVFIYSYNLTPPTLFVFSFDGNILASFEVKKKYLYFLYRATLFPEDEGIKILKLKEGGEYELHFIRLEDERGKDVRLLSQDGNTVLLHFSDNWRYEGNFYILDLESLELRRINLGISKFSFLSVAIEDGSIFILDVEGRIFRKVSVDGTILCEQKIEELRVCPDYCDFYFFCLPLCSIFSVLP
jgi:hypothetical protein